MYIIIDFCSGKKNNEYKTIKELINFTIFESMQLAPNSLLYLYSCVRVCHYKMHRISQSGQFVSKRNSLSLLVRMSHLSAPTNLPEEPVETKEDRQRQEDINVYIAMGVILLITALVVFLKISFQNLFLSSADGQ